MNKFLKEVEKKSELEEVKIVIPDTHFENVNYDFAIDFVKGLNRDRNSHQYGFLTGKFIMGDIFEAMHDVYNYQFKHLIVSSLSLNENNIDSFKNLFLFGCIEKLTIIVSDFWYSHAKYKMYDYFQKEMKEYDVELVIAKTHAKIYLISNGIDTITITTSANLNSCNNIEQYELSFNKEKYEFNKKILLSIRDEFYKNNEKLIKHSKLWEIINNG